MKHSIVCGILVRVQPQDVIGADEVRGQVAIVLCDVKVPLGRSLCIGPEVTDHISGVAVIGPGVQLQKVGDEHGADSCTNTNTNTITALSSYCCGVLFCTLLPWQYCE